MSNSNGFFGNTLEDDRRKMEYHPVDLDAGSAHVEAADSHFTPMIERARMAPAFSESEQALDDLFTAVCVGRRDLNALRRIALTHSLDLNDATSTVAANTLHLARRVIRNS